MKQNRLRSLLCACALAFAPLVQAVTVRAQTAAQTASRSGIASIHAGRDAAPSRPRRIVPLRITETPSGTRVTISSDEPIDDYTTRREAERFHVLLPSAEAVAAQAPLRGNSFDEARVEQHGGDVRLVFHLRPGVSVRVTQSFNRLDLLFISQPESANEAPAPAAASPAVARADVSGAGGENLERVLRRVEELEARVRELEGRGEHGPQSSGTAATAEHALMQPRTAPDVEAPKTETAKAGTHSAGVQQSGGHHDDDEAGMAGPPRLQIQGFADINYRATNERGRTNSFALGQLDLFLTSRLSEKFSVLSELIVEAGEDNAFTFEIHRLLLRYSHNDYVNLSAGRYHTAIGYWNTAYHHGSWFATTANRPFIFAFEGKGGILPLHNVGLSMTGRVPRAPFGLRYIAEVGNGRSVRSRADRVVQTSFDENNGKAVNLGLFARPRRVPGLQTGFSVYRDRLTPLVAPPVVQTITAGYVIYQGPRYEMLNEAVFLRHTSEGRAFLTPAFYTQISRRFGRARPFFRYQYTNVPDDDPIFAGVGRRNGPSAGLRYDVSDYAAFKMQYDRTERRRLSAIDELIMQLSFTF